MFLLINDLCIGGAERALINFANHMREVRPIVVLIDPVEGLLAELSPRVEVVSLGGPIKPMVPAGSHPNRGEPRGRMLLEFPGLLRKAWRLYRLCRAKRCYTVSTFLNRSHSLAMLVRLLWLPRLRVIINVHEMLSEHLAIHFAPFERRLMRGFIRHAFPRAARIVTVSEGARQDLVNNLRVPASTITVVHNPLDLAQIRTAAGAAPETPPEPEGPLIVAVGRLVHLKGFDVLIHAVALLPEALGARLCIVGEGEERPALERLIAELGMDGRVQLLGYRANPWAIMAQADVIALGSRTEAFPSVIGEALALSRPVVATLCSDGVREYLEDGRCGVLVPPEEPEAMARALERILTDRAFRTALGQAGERRVKAFGLRETVSQYERLLSEAAAT